VSDTFRELVRQIPPSHEIEPFSDKDDSTPKDRIRASTARRGCDARHQRIRRELEPLVRAGLAVRARCREPIAAGEAWDLGHEDIDSSQEVFRGLVSLVEASSEIAPLLEKVVYSNGKEAIWLITEAAAFSARARA
jgi:hypothetical protein